MEMVCRPSFYRSSIVAKETHFRAEASRISLPRTGHVDKPREKRTDNTTGHRREVRNDVRPERVACAHRLLTSPDEHRVRSLVSVFVAPACMPRLTLSLFLLLLALSLSFRSPLLSLFPFRIIFSLVLLYVACIPWKIFDLSSRYFFVSLPLVHCESRDIRSLFRFFSFSSSFH